MRDNHVDRPLVVGPGHDNVGEPVRRLDKVVKGGFDKAQVLVEDAGGVAAALDEVSSETSREHEIRVALDKDLEIEKVAQFLVVQHEDSLDCGGMSEARGGGSAV